MLAEFFAVALMLTEFIAIFTLVLINLFFPGQPARTLPVSRETFCNPDKPNSTHYNLRPRLY